MSDDIFDATRAAIRHLRAAGYVVLPPAEAVTVHGAINVLREVRAVVDDALDKLAEAAASIEERPPKVPELVVDLYREGPRAILAMSDGPDAPLRNVEVGVGVRCPECRGGAFHKMDCSRRGEPLPPEGST